MTVERSNCIFCDVIDGQAPGETVYKDDLVVCIKSTTPRSTHHYLVLSKRHIDDVKTLQGPEDEKIFEHMVKTLPILSKDLGFDLDKTRTGFRWPPFQSVNHLHLHVISPIQNMKFSSRLRLLPNTFWFVSIEYVRSRFRTSS